MKVLQITYFNSAKKKRIISKDKFQLLMQAWKDVPYIDEIENIIYYLQVEGKIKNRVHFRKLKKVLNRLSDVDYNYYIKENLGNSYYRVKACLADSGLREDYCDYAYYFKNKKLIFIYRKIAQTNYEQEFYFSYKNQNLYSIKLIHKDMGEIAFEKETILK
jgi:hypothetical protein